MRVLIGKLKKKLSKCCDDGEKEYQWYDVRFEYNINIRNFEKLLIDHIVPFIEKHKDEVRNYHFLHHSGLDLRFLSTEKVRYDLDNKFKNLKMLERPPYNNHPDNWIYAWDNPDPYLLAQSSFLATTSRIIVNLIRAKREKKITHSKIYGVDRLYSRTVIPDFTHLLLSQLTFVEHLDQSEIFYKLSKMWEYSAILNQLKWRTDSFYETLLDAVRKGD